MALSYVMKPRMVIPLVFLSFHRITFGYPRSFVGPYKFYDVVFDSYGKKMLWEFCLRLC